MLTRDMINSVLTHVPQLRFERLPSKNSLTHLTLVSLCTHKCLSNLSCASYLCNHQQISQSTSGLNTARAVLDGSHLLGALLNFIRQDLNTDEVATQHTTYRVLRSCSQHELGC